jgi:hypothetical protein
MTNDHVHPVFTQILDGIFNSAVKPLGNEIKTTNTRTLTTGQKIVEMIQNEWLGIELRASDAPLLAQDIDKLFAPPTPNLTIEEWKQYALSLEKQLSGQEVKAIAEKAWDACWKAAQANGIFYELDRKDVETAKAEYLSQFSSPSSPENK